MDNIHNDELSGSSNKGNIDDRMGGNMNEGIQNKKVKYNKNNDNISLSTNIFGKSEENSQKSHEKINNLRSKYTAIIDTSRP